MASVWLCRSDLSLSSSSSVVDVKQPYLVESKPGFSLFLSIILAIHFFAGIHRVSLTLFTHILRAKDCYFYKKFEYANGLCLVPGM